MVVKNIILDFGGVLLDIDYHQTELAFRKLGVSNFEKIYSQASQTNLFNKLEIGKITETDFFEELKKLSGLDSITAEQIREAWNAMLITFPKENYLMLQQLKKKYIVFLLSNTNEIHISAFEKLIEKICPVKEFERQFKKFYYSCRIGLRKPNVDCFLYVLNDSKLNKEETIFIDDSIQHIKGAKKAGIRSYLLKKNVKTIGLLKDLGLLDQ